MTVFQLKVYDPNICEVNYGLFKTRALAMRQKSIIEEKTGHRLNNDEYEFININVIEYIPNYRVRSNKEIRNEKYVSDSAS